MKREILIPGFVVLLLLNILVQLHYTVFGTKVRYENGGNRPWLFNNPQTCFGTRDGGPE